MARKSDLLKFVKAQESVYPSVVSELREGRKTSHWMWFIFPQIRGLGSSSTAKHYAIESLEEAREYVAHPILGARLKECTELVLIHRNSSADEIFGFPDALKFRSSMTLFDAAAKEQVFSQALEQFYGGQRDQRTLELL